MMAEAMKEEWTLEKGTRLTGVWIRKVPKEWQKFSLDPNDIKEKLIAACKSTAECKLINFSCKTLDMAIQASYAKAECENCTHTHYGLIKVPRGLPQPVDNLTRESAIRRIAHYDPSSDKYFKNVKSLSKG